MRFLPICLLVVLSCSTAAADTKLDWNRDIKPILARNCFACHGPDDGHREAGLRLDQREAAIKARKKGAALVPGMPQMSRAVVRILDPTDPMPPKETGNHLTAEEIAKLRAWIAQGAEYAEHWSFVKPTRPPIPTVKNRAWVRTPVDAFILARLEAEGLEPNPEADRFALLRRASLDLRGLPPTFDEVELFRRDTAPQAYERMIDRFLSDSAYGERLARMWLDLARYADSAGYGSDPLRPNMWRYRDWVIDAFNHNIPYDQFTIEQLAGDLLPNPTTEQRMATAFHRNTQTNTEGGTDDEEYRVVAVKDRTDTTMQVWMGLTFGCAKCHSHKYDPITHTDYYRLYAVFNQTEDSDRGDEFPTMPAPTPLLTAQVQAIDERIARLREELNHGRPDVQQAQIAWEASLKPADAWQRLEATIPAGTYTAFRLRGKSLPANGLKLTLGDAGKALIGRTVRIELPGPQRILALAEVQVFRNGENIARQGEAVQSSTDFDGPAKLAIDGNTNGAYYEGKSVTHTKTEANPWWQVTLPAAGPIERIVVWNRTDGVGDRLAGARVLLLDDQGRTVWSTVLTQAPQVEKTLALDGVREVEIAERFPTPDGEVLIPAQPTVVSAPTKWSIGVADAALDATADKTFPALLALPKPIRTILRIPAANRTPQQADEIATYYRSITPLLQEVRAKIAALEKSRPQVPNLPVMQELPTGRRRQTKILLKGDFLNPGESVTAGLPSAFAGKQSSTEPNRLQLARWLMHPENPLTARVAVNRFWSLIFGIGLVETEEDFGTQGDYPTHPELLDWLAVEFRESGWDVKRLLRLYVTSSTYRQSARVDAEKLAKDPRNRLLSRGSRYRLEAEQVRDQALALSGLLTRKVGGPSVFPPQPEGLWQAAFNGQRTWPNSTGGDRHRRGLYTFWRRTIPYPSMTTFDAPSREICTVRRGRSNTPLQAFVTLNDPVYVEAAQGLARRMMREGGSTPKERIAFGLRVVLARPDVEAKIEPLLTLYEAELQAFRADPKRAALFATNPLGPLPDGSDVVEAAALTTVANVLLNLDAVLTK